MYDKLFFSFKAFIKISHFLFIFVFICLIPEGRRRRRKTEESRVGTSWVYVAYRKRGLVRKTEEFTLELRSEG